MTNGRLREHPVASETAWRPRPVSFGGDDRVFYSFRRSQSAAGGGCDHELLMRVTAAAATMSAAAVAFTRRRAAAGVGRSKGGKLLGDFGGAAMRAFRPLPVGRAHQDFAVAVALFAMKFVDRHGLSIKPARKFSSRAGRPRAFARRARQHLDQLCYQYWRGRRDLQQAWHGRDDAGRNQRPGRRQSIQRRQFYRRKKP